MNPVAMEAVSREEASYDNLKSGLDTPGVNEVPYFGSEVPSKTTLHTAGPSPFARSSEYPSLDYTSWATFKNTLELRLRSIFTKRFLAIVIWGQVLSVCITATNVTTTELSIHGWQLPTTQSFFVYLTLFACYTPYTIYAYGFGPWLRLIKTDGWRYFILAAVDVEANYTVVKAYQYTDILSASLLDCWATPVCMVVTYFLVRARYHWSQVLGVLVAISGLALLIVSDFKVNGAGEVTGVDKPKGDGFMLLGSTLYGVSNGLEEYFIRNRPMYEVVGQLGMWGTIIGGIQAAGLEHNGIAHVAVWSGSNVGFLIAFVSSMLVIYTTAPLLFRYSSSPFYNLSLLTSDFWSLCFGIGIFHARTYWLYGIAFPLVIVGLVIYFSCTSPQHQADETMHVVARGKRANVDHQAT